MNIAVIFAGGTGQRMKSEDIPKQFLKIDGKPIIIHTLEKFSQHNEIDTIVIACLESWIDELKRLIEKYQVTKVQAIVPGGKNGHDSIHNALFKAYETASDDDIVLICDGVRPMVSTELITNCIATAKVYETAVPVTPSIDSVLWSEDAETCNKSLPRKEMFITQAPQGYIMRKIVWAHNEAEKRGITNPISSSELLIELGERVHIFLGDRENIKVTTPEDLHALRAGYYYEHYKKFVEEEIGYGY